MADSTNTPVTNASTGSWDHDKVDFVLRDPVRRAIVIALSDGKPRAASQLRGQTNRSLHAVHKQLLKMRAKGTVVMQADPGDNRRWAFVLSAGPVVKESSTGRFIDLGYILLRVGDRQ